MVNSREYYDKVFTLLEEHHKWFSESIPLIASENVPSAAVREAVASDFGNRYAEGWPGERVYAGCIYIDQIENICIKLAKELFKAEFVDVRPTSGVCSNLVAYTAFNKPGDRIMALSIPNGGHISYGKMELGGTAGAVRGLKLTYFPFDHEKMNIDVDKTKNKIEKLKKEGKKVTMAMFGASVFLFPHPVKELADYFKNEDITICYDAAHVLGLIAGGIFQDPLKEGCDVITGSTHKTMFGSQGGIVISWNRYADIIKKATFPGNVSNHHLHHLAAKAVAFAEMLTFGQEYTQQIVKNAQALGQALYERDFQVLGENKNFTESHTVLIDITKYGDGRTIEKKLEDANIILNRNLLPYDLKFNRHFEAPGGIRCGLSECTRLGMKENDMVHIAEFIERIVVKGENPQKVKIDVSEFRKNFNHICFAFETSGDAYEYFKFRM
jgi:glycine hydroxymethyltransferase